MRNKKKQGRRESNFGFAVSEEGVGVDRPDHLVAAAIFARCHRPVMKRSTTATTLRRALNRLPSTLQSRRHLVQILIPKHPPATQPASHPATQQGPTLCVPDSFSLCHRWDPWITITRDERCRCFHLGIHPFWT